jgi:hypothetical protein
LVGRVLLNARFGSNADTSVPSLWIKERKNLDPSGT